MVDSAFFVVDGSWYEPTHFVRGPWSADACHAGPPAAAIARELERARPEAQLTRLTLDLGRPVPMGGFQIETELVHLGRTVTTSQATLSDAQGRVCVRASGMHLTSDGPFEFPPAVPVHPGGSRAQAQPGHFSISQTTHGEPSILSGGFEVYYPPGQNAAVGPTTIWMRTIPLVANETPSPFQRMCTLADCGNALSRKAEPWEVTFLNADLTISLHRPPEGEWMGSAATSNWEPNGIGVSDALLFDEAGVVGRALQTLVLRPTS